MSILSACQSAAIRLVGRRPTTIFGSSDQFELEIQDLVQDVAVEIAKKHDWQALTKLGTVTGDAVLESFALPDDYDRMPLKAALHSSRWFNSYFSQAYSLDQWLNEQTFSTVGAPGWWIILGGRLQIFPAMSLGETASFYYITKNIALDKDAVEKPVINADDDTFRLDERLLTLGLIWRWRSQKRLEYAEDLKTFEIALSEIIAKDRGPRILAVGRPSFPGNVRTAYPGALGQ